MEYKVGDKVRVRIDLVPSKMYGNLTFWSGDMSKCAGQICTIKEAFDDKRYWVSENPFMWSEEMLEPVAPTLAEIKEKKLTCCINVRSIAEAQFLDDFFECKSYLKEYCENAYKERMRLGYFRTLEDGVAFQLTDGVINDNCSANFYRSCGSRYGEVYEFLDLFPVGSIMMGGNCAYKHTESGIEKYKITETPHLPTSERYKLTFKNGSSIEALPQKDDTIRGENHFCDGFRGGKKPEYVLNEKQAKEYADNIMATAELISDITGISYENSINQLKTCLGTFPNDGISAKNGGKNSMKFTFYVTEGYRIDKSNNTRIPTMTTEVLINGKDYQYGGSATCDKTDYEEREGVLNAIANAVCSGNFDREFNKVMKNKAFANKKSRTCTYCGQVFDTVEEKQEHEAWHVECKKARRERYLLRKRAKEIAFEEQAQKMAKEMMK